jgi:Asp-tRNA(Asn)/Glu-tRNA(Gln) amidotransferase C subunit
MPKRKRDDTPSVEALFARHRTDLFHALKSAKGFERQRQSKRLSDPKSDPAKRARIANEIAVLKSLDLQQTAHAHLCSSLLKVKTIAEEKDKLPEEIRQGVPKPELTEEERAALHNVTSSLYNRVEVKRVVEKAVETVCKALRVAVPGKKGKGTKEGVKVDSGVGNGKDVKEKKKEGKKEGEKIDQAEDVEEELGPGTRERKKKEKVDQVDQLADDEVDQEEEEKAISQLDKLLGLESDDEESDEEGLLVKGRTKKPSSTELDPMEITTDEEGGDEDLDPMEITSDEGDSGSEDEFNGFSDDDEAQQSSASDDEDASDAESSASSISRPPPPKKAKKAKGALKPHDSTFLPSLMGGYISGSESASDIDVAPERKNRRGQRARQALWEKKFGEKAKHLQEPAKGRDSGWDLKRGAVDGNAKPWKQGIRNPLSRPKGTGANEMDLGGPKKEPAPRQRDDSGPLHPSWEARRLAKAKEQLSAPFQGKKITFD